MTALLRARDLARLDGDMQNNDDRRQIVPNDTSKLGWRVRELRLRRGLTQIELARLAKIDASYLSRVEREAFDNATPKPDTITRILDALKAAPEERSAVFHVEEPAPGASEIAACVREVSSQEEENPDLLAIVDDRWFRWYYNRAARAVWGLSAEDYERSLGEHSLVSMVDSHSPVYSRYPDDERASIFTQASAAFRVVYAGEEFDRWYIELFERLTQIPMARDLLSSPPDVLPMFIERQEFEIVNPLAGRLRLYLQMNHLVRHPRFVLVQMSALDRETEARIAELRKHTELFYPLPDQCQPGTTHHYHRLRELPAAYRIGSFVLEH